MRLAALLALLIAPGASAQILSSPLPELTDASRVALVTILPGDAVYSFWGHSALRVVDPALGIDANYNYGTFDFGESVVGFVARFANGELDYMLARVPNGPVTRYYAQREDRAIIEQWLDLDRAQRTALFHFLETNLRDPYYRYDFLRDNCSTRVRDALDAALGDALDWNWSTAPGLDATFRHLIDPYVQHRPVIDLGIDLGLGLPVDATASAREATFLPDYLLLAAADATIHSDAGRRPLVARTDTVYWNPNGGRPMADRRVWLTAGLWLLFGVVLAFTVRGWRRREVPKRRWPDRLLFAVVGLAGVLVAFLWFVSEHTVTGPNLHLLWAWPTHLVAVFFVGRRGLRPYALVYAAVVLVLALGWPFWPQHLPAAALPLVLIVALRALNVGRLNVRTLER